MINKGTFALFAATAVLSLALPEFAQSEERYGGTRPNYYDSSGSQKYGSWGPEEQGSADSNQTQTSGSSSQSAERRPGYSALGYAPASRQRPRETR